MIGHFQNMNRRTERSVNAENEDDGDEEHYGVTDYRSIKPWMFAARLLLKPRKRAKMSIGMLHVKVVEARGLMARDGLLGRSDPYVKLDLTGRYISNGQEWSEHLRIQEQTRVIKYTLNPVWNEEFSLPVRRAGAVLRVELWDWDRGSTDDSLGSFEVKIGEELLSQKLVCMILPTLPILNMANSALEKTNERWFVLEPPRDMKGTASSAVPDVSEVKANRHTEQQQLSEVEEEEIIVEEAEEAAESGAAGPALAWPSVLNPDSEGILAAQHDHIPGEESSACEACIEYRREKFGEVRLELRFEFDEFGETCSHFWPEEPPKPAEMTFSPNRVYYNALLLQQLAQPYIGCMIEANAVVHWVTPWKSFLWFVALVVLLLHPCLLIIAINGSLVWIVSAAFLDFRKDEADDEGATNNQIGATTRHSYNLKRRPLKVPLKSLLPPIDEPRDRELKQMYQAVRKTKKLPQVVEQIGRRTFAVDALPAQRQVENIGSVLMTVRRRFHPVKARPYFLMIFALASHALLQLWLYRSSRFHLYLLGLCVGVFAYNFYRWRGRAYIAGIKEAVRCRQVRIALSDKKQTPSSAQDIESGPGHEHSSSPPPTIATVKSTAENSRTEEERTLTEAPRPSLAAKGGARKLAMLSAKRKSVRFAEDPEGGEKGGASSAPGGKEPPHEVDGVEGGRRKNRDEGARAWEGLASFGAATGPLPDPSTYGSLGVGGSAPAGGRPASAGGGLGGGKEEQAMPSRPPLRRWNNRNEESKSDRGGGGAEGGALLLDSDEDSPQEQGTAGGWRGRISGWYHDF